MRVVSVQYDATFRVSVLWAKIIFAYLVDKVDQLTSRNLTFDQSK